MRFFYTLTAALFLLCFSLSAQKSTEYQWTPSGNGFYDVSNNEIVLTELPNFTQKIIASKKQLTPKEKDAPLGFDSFEIDSSAQKILLFTNTKKVWRYHTKGDYWMLDLKTNALFQLGSSLPPSSLMFAKLSPDGKSVAYTALHNIYVEDLATKKIKALTKDGNDRIINGTFDWVYEEEFGCRDGFRWSPDSKKIAFWQIDARKIKNFLMLNNTDSIYAFTIPVEYPKVGEDPSSAKIGTINLVNDKTVWMKIPGSPIQNYLPRMEWTPSGKDLIVQQLDRKQQRETIYLSNADNGNSVAIYKDSCNSWIDTKSRWNDDDPTKWEWVDGGKNFLWISEKDGWRHIYKIGTDGKNQTLLTKGNYDIIALNHIDEQNGYVYFLASPENATQKYLYRVALNGNGNLEKVSPAHQLGTHSYAIAPNGLFAEHRFSNLSTYPTKTFVNLNNHQVLKDIATTKPSNKKFKTPQLFTITTDEGVQMDGWRILPKNFDSTKKYPVLFYVYTEPGSATVKDRFGAARGHLFNEEAVADGYIIVSLDGRGTPAPKGAAWRKSIYGKVGILNVKDQAMAAKKILEWNFVDTNRVAVWGWSGGGSTTLNLLFQYPNIYKTGIAVAPVTNRLTYDNIYEERYMGLPQENKAAYQQASAISYAKNLQGNLLLIHGTGDDNVHFQNTEMLINELVKYNKQFSLMIYPNRSHSINEGEGTFGHLSGLFTNYLKMYCPPGGR